MSKIDEELKIILDEKRRELKELELELQQLSVGEGFHRSHMKEWIDMKRKDIVGLEILIELPDDGDLVRRAKRNVLEDNRRPK
jgi:hypothetical protein